MNKTCLNCKYFNNSIIEEPCNNCDNTSNWKEKHCIDCTNYNVSSNEEPCKSCLYSNKLGFKLKEQEEHKTEKTSNHEVTLCVNCKYRHTNTDDEPCKSCTINHSNWSERYCTDCKHSLVSALEEPCSTCIGLEDKLGILNLKPKFELDGTENTEITKNYEEHIKSCIDCKYFSKDINEKPCNECRCVNKGEHSYWEVVTAPTITTTTDTEETEEIFCEDCKYADLGTDEEPCNRCKQNSGNIAEDHDKLTLCYEPKETESEQESEDTKAHCDTCKHVDKSLSESPCNNCCDVGMGDDCYYEPKETKSEAESKSKIQHICSTCIYADYVADCPCADCITDTNRPHWKRRDCESCKYTHVDLKSEPCKSCEHMDIGEPSNWEVKQCIDCLHENKKDERCTECMLEYKKPYFRIKEDTQPEIIEKFKKLLEESLAKDGNLRPANEEPQTAREIIEANKERIIREEMQKAHSVDNTEPFKGFTDECCNCYYYETSEGKCPLAYHCCKGNGTTHNLFVPSNIQRKEEHYDEHYHDKVQPLEIMQEIMTPEEFKGFLFGNIIKYTCRCGKKDEPQKEFAKLRRYREWYDMAVMSRHIDPRI